MRSASAWRSPPLAPKHHGGYPPLQIINTFLLDGMKVVGELFGSGQMHVPFVRRAL